MVLEQLLAWNIKGCYGIVVLESAGFILLPQDWCKKVKIFEVKFLLENSYFFFLNSCSISFLLLWAMAYFKQKTTWVDLLRPVLKFILM